VTSRTTAASAVDSPHDLAVRIEFGPVFEMLTIAQALLYKRHHSYYDLGREWFAKVGRESPETFEQLRGFLGGSAMVWDHLFGLATEVDPRHEIGSFVQHVAGMDPATLRLELLGIRYRHMQRTVGIERLEAAATGNATAQRDVLRLAWPEDNAWQTGLRELLKAPPEQTKAALVEVLHGLERDLARYVETSVSALEADAAEKRQLAKELSGLELIRTAIDTAYVPTGDVQGVVLIPSFVVRPMVYYFEFGDEMLFVYPVSDRQAAALGIGPPDRLVRLAFALGDRGRLRILELLKQGGMTLKEIGDELGVPRSTLRHHMGILRIAGLVRPMQTGAGFNAYQLREEAATDLSEMVEKFLRGPS
jgi:DNA-binding transcriptional ArsR family regulator